MPLFQRKNKTPLGIYIHIPFCVKKCNYCDFYSLGCVANGGIERYIDALCVHIREEGKKYADRVADTVFLGGGTPSLLSPESIKRLFCSIREAFVLSDRCEISIEVNPGTLNSEKAQTYKEIGINRVSIGLQSVCDRELKALGRIHTLEDFKECYRLLRDAGLNNTCYCGDGYTCVGVSFEFLKGGKSVEDCHSANPATH